ncbi:WD40 repeat-like protein [Tilletiopsis washingtonensis]|uniref:Ribosome biogenesis protein YTM1 n=1 Tax=Tilletiopsis washingtonensis TaxID=58919 RepID=A0A316Z0F4_9BASI|nr:WD40 repeat-like protein [Tilletiopsis washingtonensis]PWN95217.1 WD40 repeat-like protein [Tilletiopsis washingtonensis]
MTTLASTSAAPAPAAPAVRQVPIVLRTSLATLQIPQQPYLVPLSWRRTQLSTLVNRLLSPGDAASAASIPFDFIIDGELLRGSIDAWLAAHGRTEEETLDIEYVRSTLPPRFASSRECDDWLSDIDARSDGLFLTAAYDSTLRLFGATGTEPLLTQRVAAPGGLTSARFIGSDAEQQVLATGMDGTIHLLSLSSTSAGPEQMYSATHVASGAAHGGSVRAPLCSLSVRGSQALAAGWDGCVSLWLPTSLAARSDADESRSKKKRRAERGVAAPEGARLEPLATLWHAPPNAGVPSANARVGGVVWGAEGKAYSAGWNGSVREWDVDSQSASSSKTSDKVLLCLDHMAGSAPVLLTGHVDRSIGIWDMRLNAAAITLPLASAHSAPVSAVRAHPSSAHLFASASHDGSVKLWDARSPKAALFALSRPPAASGEAAGKGAEKEKVLALDWTSDGQAIASGGEDKRLTLHRGEGIGRE